MIVFILTSKFSFKDEVTRAEIRKLAEANDEEALKARLGSRMSFGTAGNL